MCPFRPEDEKAAQQAIEEVKLIVKSLDPVETFI